MQDPQVFYNKEDLWVVPRLAHEGRDASMEPYFTVMRLPGESREEFVLLSPFNPSGRDNMIALLAARIGPAQLRPAHRRIPSRSRSWSTARGISTPGSTRTR